MHVADAAITRRLEGAGRLVDLPVAQGRTMAPDIRIVFATDKGEVNNRPDAVVPHKPYALSA